MLSQVGRCRFASRSHSCEFGSVCKACWGRCLAASIVSICEPNPSERHDARPTSPPNSPRAFCDIVSTCPIPGESAKQLTPITRPTRGEYILFGRLRRGLYANFGGSPEVQAQQHLPNSVSRLSGCVGVRDQLWGRNSLNIRLEPVASKRAVTECTFRGRVWTVPPFGFR